MTFIGQRYDHSTPLFLQPLYLNITSDEPPFPQANVTAVSRSYKVRMQARCISLWLGLSSWLAPTSTAWTLNCQRSSPLRANNHPQRRSQSPRRPWTWSHLRMTSETPTTARSASSIRPLPRLPLPEPICSDTPGTWAYDTMSRRVRNEILQRTWDDNADTWSQSSWATVRSQFEQLCRELETAATTPITYLDETSTSGSTDAADNILQEESEWRSILQPYVERGDTWLTAPWMVTEFYVYRRVVQAIGYFDPHSVGYQYDPFAKQKQAGLQSSVGSAEALLSKISQLPPTKEGLGIAASIALWGNKMDLSLWPADASHATIDVFTEILEQAHVNLLHDDSDILATYCDKLRNRGGGQIDIIVDNAGFELVTDLALAQFLIQSGTAQVVTFQLKSMPTFVSDALEKDLLDTVGHYENLDPLQFPHAFAAGTLWRQFLRSGKWVCYEHRFWVQPYAMWDMTEPLRTDLSQRCDLAFVKGDANYRRLLGDRQWDYTAPFQEVVGAYFPCPVCALRTLKAELGCGMDAEQVKRAKELDDNWLVNGRFGVVQFGTGTGRS